MIYNKNIGAQLLGVLFKTPELLADTDKYLLTTDDFPERLPRMIFGFIFNLYHSGMEKFTLEDFVKEIAIYPEQLDFFSKNHGEDFLLTSIEMGKSENFDFYYQRVKKLSLLRALKDGGFDISNWYVEDLYDIHKREQLENKLEDATLQEILSSIQAKYFDIESTFINKKNFKFGTVETNLDNMLANLGKETAIGLPINGEILSTIILGARKNKMFIMSGESGAGKSRYAIASACKLAFPILWDKSSHRWSNSGSNQKIIFITTELGEDEVQTIILAFVSGVDEDRILSNRLTKEERERLHRAVNIVKAFKDNFYIYQLPDPNVNQLNVNVRRYVIRYQLDAVFFDYIHTSPNLLSEFSGAKVREDVALMLLSTALKNLANELDVFIWSGTQINSNIEPGKLAGVECIRGSKAIMDKADVGMILRKVAPEDLKLIAALSSQTGLTPTHSIDIFKNRRGKHNKVRLWVQLDLGVVSTQELFLTDEYGALLSIDIIRTRDITAKIDNMELILNRAILEEKPKVKISL